MFGEIVSIVAPVFICTALGFCWSKSGKSFDTSLVTSIVTYFGTPSLVFATLSTVKLDPKSLYLMGEIAVAANVAFVVIGAAFLALFRLDQRAFLQSLSFPNIGNIGLPLCFLAFGENGLALAITFFAVYVVLQLTVGVAFLAGEFNIKSVLKMPIIPATLLAVAFLATGTKVPGWAYNTTKMIGDLTIPLMLITLGVSLASLKVSNLKRALGLSILRLTMGFVVGVGLAMAFGLEGDARGVIIVECALPVAVFCYLLAQHYNRSAEEVAGVVVISTGLSIFTLPLLMWYVL